MSIRNLLITFLILLSRLGIAQHIQVPKTSNSKKIVKDSLLTVKGRVLDFHSGKAVPHLELQVNGTDKVQTTDAKGRFKFILPDSLAQKTLVLDITPVSQRLLDSVGAIIPPENLTIDKARLKNEVIIYRYPLSVLPKVVVSVQMLRHRTINIE